LADTNCDEPLAGVQVTLSNCERNVISTVASDACGEFCINTNETGLLTLSFERKTIDGEVLIPSLETVDAYVDACCPTSVCVQSITYSPQLGQVCGRVTDGSRGLECIPVELFASGKCAASTQTDAYGFFAFQNISAGKYEVRFPKQVLTN